MNTPTPSLLLSPLIRYTSIDIQKHSGKIRMREAKQPADRARHTDTQTGKNQERHRSGGKGVCQPSCFPPSQSRVPEGFASDRQPTKDSILRPAVMHPNVIKLQRRRRILDAHYCGVHCLALLRVVLRVLILPTPYRVMYEHVCTSMHLYTCLNSCYLYGVCTC